MKTIKLQKSFLEVKNKITNGGGQRNQDGESEIVIMWIRLLTFIMS